jgi:hypothetical protein
VQSGTVEVAGDGIKSDLVDMVRSGIIAVQSGVFGGFGTGE